MLNCSKMCIACGEIKPLNMYTKNAASLDGHIGTCKKCKAKQQRERRAKAKAVGALTEKAIKDAKRRRNNHLKISYGIDESVYKRCTKNNMVSAPYANNLKALRVGDYVLTIRTLQET